MNPKRQVMIIGIIIIFVVSYLGFKEGMRYKDYSDGLKVEVENLKQVKRELEEEYADFVVGSTDEKADLSGEIEELKEQSIKDKADINQLKKEQARLFEEVEGLTGPDMLGREKLNMMGIPNYMVIEDSLYSLGEEIIGFDGVLGGTMMFLEVRILNDKWAYGIFEDGHILGRGLYEYNISEDKKITWKIIKEFLDE